MQKKSLKKSFMGLFMGVEWMDNTEKLIRALIKAQGYEIEEVSATRDGKVIPDSVCYYKLTKKATNQEYEHKWCGDFGESILQ